MTHHIIDTIAAIATPSGRGGVGIVRVSGPNTVQVAQRLLGKLPQPRMAEYSLFKQDDQVIDIGLALYFPKPHSFTGEDVLELQGHGGPIIMDMLLSAVLQEGVRLAKPGEFSEQAFINDKLDLTQAEAIADLIDSASQQAARSAMRSLQGEFSQRIQLLQTELSALRVFVEAAIDFPEEEIDFLADQQLNARIIDVKQKLIDTLQAAQQGNLLKEGMVVVIAGRPNAGKSTLLNRLTGEDTAIVTSVPGTTRDILKANIDLDGIPLHIIDTAGLRNSEETQDPIEQEGIRRAWQAIKQADRILYIVDAHQGFNAADDEHLKSLIGVGPGLSLVHNKVDLGKMANHQQSSDHWDNYWVSAKTGEGITALKKHLSECVGYQSSGEGQFIARRRHIHALERALECIELGEQQLIQYQAGELLAEELRRAQLALSEITGEVRADELLGEIFSSFCIGK